MTRLWTRFIHSIQKIKGKKKLPVIVFDEFATPPNYLKESALYGYYLVRIEKLEYAYNMLLINQNKKSYSKMKASLLQVWYSELAKVAQQSQNALTLLGSRLDNLSQELGTLSSPLKNRDRHSLKKAQKFIATRLKEWDTTPNCTTTALSSGEKPVKCRTKFSLASDQHPFFLETAWQHKTIYDLRDSQFQSYFEDIEIRIRQEFGSKNLKLAQCIRQVYHLQHDFSLHHRYLTSQFSLLWDLGSVFLNTLIDSEQEPTLYEAIKTKWKHQYHHHLTSYQDLENKFKETLEANVARREDFTCAICLSVLCEPVTLSSCHHTFCKSCIQQLYCTRCHHRRSRTMNRISQNLGSIISKTSPVVHCTCHIIDRTSGEPTLLRKQHKAACPLCRIDFDSDQCTEDLILGKFIYKHFPKRKYDGEEVDIGDENQIKKVGLKKRSKSFTRRCQRGEDEASRRRSQINGSKFYAKMQRWSHKQTDSPDITDENIPPAVPVGTSQLVRSDMLSIARQTWMF